MAVLRPRPTPYDPLAWVRLPLAERGRQACEAWALDGYGAPAGVYLAHLAKLALYGLGWVAWCSATPGLGGLTTIDAWWLAPAAFQKAILWSMLFEGLGLGCGFGPLTGRYVPPLGGALYFLRPGTTKLAATSLPLIGGHRRSWLDVAVYAAVLALLVRALLAPAPGLAELAPLAIAVPLLGVLDRTAFLALRPEHYATTIACFVLAPDAWLPGAMVVQLALWWWAGVSKLNHHFPTVVCAMSSNSPLRWPAFRRALYRGYPRDLRPSRLATWIAHAGTALELSVAVSLALAPAGPWLVLGLALAIALHAFITGNVPMGVPIEWNAMSVYAAFALFAAHPTVSPLDVLATPALAVLLAVAVVAVPVVGNLAPARISFLLAMRYYAGNWPYSVWLFRGDSYRKLDRLTKTAPWIHDQLAHLYDHATAVGLVGKVLAFRLMHLQGRALPVLVPRALAGADLADYEYLDGELVAGLALGWNFGDGHLHHEQLLRALQAQCAFEPGELRCIFVEAQPLGGRALAYRIHDAAEGLREAGSLDVAALRAVQPWQAAPGAPGEVARG